MLDVSLFSAFIGGLIVFFSPCVLPIVPFYLSYMAGATMSEISADGALAPGLRRRAFLASVMFSLAALYMKDNLPLKAKPLLETILSVDATNTDAQDLLEEVEHNLAQKPHDYLVYPSVYPTGQIVSAQEAASC